MLTREFILEQLNAVADSVAVPELGGVIGIRRLSYSEAVALAETAAAASTTAAQETFMVDLVLLCACDGRGERLFQDADADAVRRLPAMAMQRITDAVLRVNALHDQAVEDAVGNSETTPDDDGS
ncbi:MAG: hypothetical protein ACOCXA_02830 [Planctomycetota bacterium]